MRTNYCSFCHGGPTIIDRANYTQGETVALVAETRKEEKTSKKIGTIGVVTIMKKLKPTWTEVIKYKSA